MEIITNPFRRCSLCKGREVLTVEGDEVVMSSLVEHNGKLMCSNLIDCNRNIKAENSKVTFSVDDKGKIHGVRYDSDNENEFFEVRKNDFQKRR